LNDREKRRKNIASPVNGMFGFEARAFLEKLAKMPAEEWKKPYSTVRASMLE